MIVRLDQIEEFEQLYLEGVPLKRICLSVGITQQLVRYHLQKRNMLKPERERRIEYLKQAIMFQVPVDEIAKYLGVRKCTAERYLSEMGETLVDIKSLPANPYEFKSAELVGKDRMQYNLRLLREVHLPTNCAKCKEQLNEIRDILFDVKLVTQIKHLVPSTFLRWLRKAEIEGENCHAKTSK